MDQGIQDLLRSIKSDPNDRYTWERLLHATRKLGIQVSVTGNIAPGTNNPFFTGILENIITNPESDYPELLLLRPNGGGTIFTNEVVLDTIKLIYPENLPETPEQQINNLRQRAEFAINRGAYDEARQLHNRAENIMIQGGSSRIEAINAMDRFDRLIQDLKFKRNPICPKCGKKFKHDSLD